MKASSISLRLLSCAPLALIAAAAFADDGPPLPPLPSLPPLPKPAATEPATPGPSLRPPVKAAPPQSAPLPRATTPAPANPPTQTAPPPTPADGNGETGPVTPLPQNGNGHAPAYAEQRTALAQGYQPDTGIDPSLYYADAGPYGGRYPQPVGSPYHYNPDWNYNGGNAYDIHFGPGFYRSGEYGHLRFPYYSYRRPWYFPGPAVYVRDTNLHW